jgi:hypothetical protein
MHELLTQSLSEPQVSNTKEETAELSKLCDICVADNYSHSKALSVQCAVCFRNVNKNACNRFCHCADAEAKVFTVLRAWNDFVLYSFLVFTIPNIFKIKAWMVIRYEILCSLNIVHWTLRAIELYLYESKLIDSKTFSCDLQYAISSNPDFGNEISGRKQLSNFVFVLCSNVLNKVVRNI